MATHNTIQYNFHVSYERILSNKIAEEDDKDSRKYTDVCTIA